VQKTIFGLKTGSAAAAVAKTEMCGGWSKERKEIWLQIGCLSIIMETCV